MQDLVSWLWETESDHLKRPFGIPSGGEIAPYPIIDETREKLVTDLAKQVLEVYNNQNNVSLEFDHIVKANMQVVEGYMFYITFAARSGNNASQTFRGKVWEKICNEGSEVQFCEMVATNN
ncbi:hypothetical protein PIB30_012115 [Stylosanthes scabra]|uniref:Cystatin domain-containing protein n=1 Tax=Stylosanthes scabra TaxID=79078 RepID=A0ABU6R701_9FABA|nr:hypothetical protein [Stylosanthes scabra]